MMIISVSLRDSLPNSIIRELKYSPRNRPLTGPASRKIRASSTPITLAAACEKAQLNGPSCQKPGSIRGCAHQGATVADGWAIETVAVTMGKHMCADRRITDEFTKPDGPHGSVQVPLPRLWWPVACCGYRPEARRRQTVRSHRLLEADQAIRVSTGKSSAKKASRSAKTSARPSARPTAKGGRPHDFDDCAAVAKSARTGLSSSADTITSSPPSARRRKVPPTVRSSHPAAPSPTIRSER